MPPTWYMISTPLFFAAFASASSLRRSPRNGSKNASHGSAARAAVLASRKKRTLAAAIVGPDRLWRAGDVVLQLEQQPGALLEQRRQMLVAGRDWARVVADLFGQL